MTYQESVDYIENIGRFSIKNSNEHTRMCLDLLGAPDHEFPQIHIAGTNGKGSVCAFLSSILQESGRKVGLFTSPHLVRINERMSVNGAEISDEDFVRIFTKVESLAQTLEQDSFHESETLEQDSFHENATLEQDSFHESETLEQDNSHENETLEQHSSHEKEAPSPSPDSIKEQESQDIPEEKGSQEIQKAPTSNPRPTGRPSYFEMLFLMAELYFAEQQVDIAIIETGLGGRLDATNALRRPVLTVITSIGMDHMQYLGTTIPEIAAEKAGIIKPGVPCVYSAYNPAAAKVIQENAAKKGSPAYPLTPAVVETLSPAASAQFSPTAAEQLSPASAEQLSRHDSRVTTASDKAPAPAASLPKIDFRVRFGYDEGQRFTIRSAAPYQVENAALSILAVLVLRNLSYRIPETAKAEESSSKTKEVSAKVEESLGTTEEASVKAEESICKTKDASVMEEENGEEDFSYITDSHIQKGLFNMYWPGRMEEIAPRVYLDGGHNIDGIRAFLEAVEFIVGGTREPSEETEELTEQLSESTYKTQGLSTGEEESSEQLSESPESTSTPPPAAHLLFAVVSDKDYNEMIRWLGHFPWKSCTVTEIEGARKSDCGKVAELFRQAGVRDVRAEKDLARAYAEARQRQGSGYLFICGSLYLAGSLKGL